MPGQNIVNLVVTWHRLLLSGSGIMIDVVTPTMAQKNATLLLKLADQFAALHSAIDLVL